MVAPGSRWIISSTTSSRWLEKHALLFYDQRGAGRSTLASDSAALDGQRFAEDLEAVRKRFGLERVTMLGHSWGAAVAALYALRYPDRVGRILLVSGIAPERKQFFEDFTNLRNSRDSSTLRRMNEWMKAREANPAEADACQAYYVLWFGPFFGDSTALGRSRGDFCAGTPESRRNKMASVDRFVVASLGDWDWRPALRAVTAPTLVIHGTADVLSVAGARQWAAAIPNSRILVFEGVGHFPYLEVPERFAAAVDAFVAGGWPEGAESVQGR